MNKQQLAAKIWESANKLRSKIEANEYKDYILGFIFYKFLSEKEKALLKKDGWSDEDLVELTEEDDAMVRYCQKQLGYFISYDNLFSTWIAKGRDFTAADVTDALSAFNRLINPGHKKVYEKIFDTLDTGLSKLGESSGARTKAISNLLQLIKDIPMDGKQDYDVLGFVYEYLISNFAANAGKKAGEFYTPHEVSMLMSEIVANHLSDKDKIEIYDPTSGSGSLLINIGQAAAKHMTNGDNIKYYAQELKENTYNLTRMNLVMRGILPDNIVTRNGDTLEEDWPFFDENHLYSPLYVDAVVSNPPYSQQWDPSEDKRHDPRYSDYGLAPKSKADYAFLLHDLYHIKPDGIMTIVLPHGVLFRGGEEGEIRKNLVERNNIDAIIGLPSNIFFGTGIPTIIMVLRQNRENTDTLIIDASKHFVKEGKTNKLQASDIKRIVDAISQRKNVDKFCKVVSREEIRSNDYNLNIPRYVDASEKAEKWDLYSTMNGGIPNSEIDEMGEYWKAFPNLRNELFAPINERYSELKTHDVIDCIEDSSDVKHFIRDFNEAFSDFGDFLYDKLIKTIHDSDYSANEDEISSNIFGRLADIPLVDKYEAYQFLDNEWKIISNDIETIQREGFNSTKVVDPNMILKKKKDVEEEIQEGWVGRILPFELVQDTLLEADLDKIELKKNRILEIPSRIEELLDNLDEGQKDLPFINDDGTDFVAKEVKSALKDKEIDPGLKGILKEYSRLSDEERTLKREIKKLDNELSVKTKSTIENLCDEDVYELLKKKWIDPLVDAISTMAGNLINSFGREVKTLDEKYSTTFSDLEEEIRDAEKSFCKMIDQLTGNDFDMKGLADLKRLLGGE